MEEEQQQQQQPDPPLPGSLSEDPDYSEQPRQPVDDNWESEKASDFFHDKGEQNLQSEEQYVPVQRVDDSSIGVLRTRVTLVQLEEYLAIQRGLKKSCQTLPLTLMLWIMYVFTSFYHFQAYSSFESSSHIREAIEGCWYSPDGLGTRQVRLSDIGDIAKVMPWIEGALVPRLQAMEDTQTLLGYVRVQQLRGENVTICENFNEALQALYGSGCFPPGGEPGTYGPKREDYEIPDTAFEPMAGSNEQRFEFWLEIQWAPELVSQRIRQLEAEGWVDLSTQEIALDGLFLNVEAHVYTRFLLTFDFSREGLLSSELMVTPLRGEIFTHWSQVFLDVMFGVLFVVLLYSAFSDLLIAKNTQLLGEHWKDPYAWLDLLLIIIGIVIVIFFYDFVYWLNKYSNEVFSLGEMPELSMSEAPTERKVEAAIQGQEYQGRLMSILDWFEWYIYLNDWLRFLSAIFAMLIIGRFFRGFRGQPRLSVLVQTLMYSANFIVHFVLVLAFVFFNFALGGFLLFGEELEGWRTPGSSVGRMLLVLFRRFDYNEFHSVAPVSAALWFASFYILVSLLLVKVLTGAMVHNYLEVRRRLGEGGIGVVEQCTGLLKDVIFGRTFEGSQKSIPYDDLLAVLSADTDPAYLKKLENSLVDRRLLSRAHLHKAEVSKEVNEDYLVSCGCDRAVAKRLLDQCSDWVNSNSLTALPNQRIMILIARQIRFLQGETQELTSRIQRRFDRTAKVVDRIDLKHAKSLALAKRIRKAQQLPPGWTAHMDEQGRRYLRQEETGLTSWTLPKHLL